MPSSSFASLLQDRQTEEAGELACDLTGWLRQWHDQSLWAINLAPELVAHDETHAESVESLLADLVRISHRDTNNIARFTDSELVWLSIAAWLHDWGHIGGTIDETYRRTSKGSIEKRFSNDLLPKKFFEHSVYVRALHGLISQNLLSKEWEGLHKIRRQELYWPAAILCGHHQSWTSFNMNPAIAFRGKGKEVYQQELSKQLCLDNEAFEATSLYDDAGRLWNVHKEFLDKEVHTKGMTNWEKCYERLRFLLSLLRVADGADLGLHRVPDIGESRLAFLARCLHREARRVGYQLREELYRIESVELKGEGKRLDHLNEAIMVCEQIADDAMNCGGGNDKMAFSSIEFPGYDKLIEVRKLKEYHQFLTDQDKYFDDHAYVDYRGVSFESVEVNQGITTIGIVVRPSSSSNRNDALTRVTKNVIRELKTVGGVLHGAGYRFGHVGCVNPRSGKTDWLSGKRTYRLFDEAVMGSIKRLERERRELERELGKRSKAVAV